MAKRDKLLSIKAWVLGPDPFLSPSDVKDLKWLIEEIERMRRAIRENCFRCELPEASSYCPKSCPFKMWAEV